MGKLIVNADDFGYTSGVTYGILAAHQQGIVTSTTALTVSDYFQEAMEAAKRVPSLKVGVHLTLTLKGAKPLRRDVPSLTNPETGLFYSQQEFIKKVKLEEVYKEWESQIIHFLNTGFSPSHIDSHHNVHGNAKLLPVALELAKKYQLPLRRASRSVETEALDHSYGGVKATDHLLATFYDQEATRQHLVELLEGIARGNSDEIYEINCHPAYIDPRLKEWTSYLEQRLVEFDILTSQAIKDFIVEKQIELVNYAAVQVY